MLALRGRSAVVLGWGVAAPGRASGDHGSTKSAPFVAFFGGVFWGGVDEIVCAAAVVALGSTEQPPPGGLTPEVSLCRVVKLLLLLEPGHCAQPASHLPKAGQEWIIQSAPLGGKPRATSPCHKVLSPSPVLAKPMTTGTVNLTPKKKSPQKTGKFPPKKGTVPGSKCSRTCPRWSWSWSASSVRLQSEKHPCSAVTLAWCLCCRSSRRRAPARQCRNREARAPGVGGLARTCMGESYMGASCRGEHTIGLQVPISIIQQARTPSRA